MNVKINKQLKSFLWVEKYRPATLEMAVLPKKFKSFFKKIIENGETPNLLLFSSSPGSGKSSTAKLLVNELGADSLYINISLEGGIDTLRSQIIQFASTKSFVGGKKIVIMDEFDGATPALQAALRATIEEFHNHCRFILTANYITKIITPLREGRIMEFDYGMMDKPTKDELVPLIADRLCGILKYEKIEFDRAIIEKLVENYYPNMRKMISILQKYATMYDRIDSNIFSTSDVNSELFEYIIDKKFTKAREYIIQNNYDFGELYPIMYRQFSPLIADMSKRAEVIILIAQYQSTHPQAIDQELNFSAMLLEIIRVL